MTVAGFAGLCLAAGYAVLTVVAVLVWRMQRARRRFARLGRR